MIRFIVFVANESSSTANERTPFTTKLMHHLTEILTQGEFNYHDEAEPQFTSTKFT